MSLQIWLPLNGNTSNQGVADVSFVSSSVTYNSNGKLGKCLDDGSITLSSSQVPLVFNDRNCSICFWYYNKCTQAGVTTGGHNITGQNLIPNRQYSLFAYPNNDDLHYSMFGYTISPGNDSIRYSGVINDVLPIQKWTHVCMVNKNKAIYFYINGVLKESANPVNFSFDFSTQDYPLIYNSVSHMIQDFRVYDHALSLKEIKLISQGLVLHYPLSSTIKKYRNLAWNQTYAIYNNHGQPASLTKLDETYCGCDVYRLTMTVTDSTKLSDFQTGLWSHGIFGFHRTFNANTKYCFTILYRPVTHTDARVGGIASNIGGWTEIAPTYYRHGWYRVGQKRNGSVTENKTDNIYTSFYCNTLKLNEAISIDFCCPCLLEGTDTIEEDDFYEQDFSENVVYDCSGFGNDGSMNRSTAPSWDPDTVKYRGCYKFASNQFIAANQSAKVADAITVSIWGYMDKWVTDKTPISCTENGGWNFEPNGGYISFPIYVTSIGYIRAKSSTLLSSLSSDWHNFVGTYDGFTAKLYLDGNLLATTGTGKSTYLPIGYNSSNTIFIGAEAGGNSTTPGGSYFNGKISDVRIYATALSAEDIKDLYQVRASVTDNGILMVTGEVIE